MDTERILRLRKKANALPRQPGVYYMKNSAGKIIYVGKAKILPNRVSSYFTAVERHLPKVYKMVSHVEDFDYIITSSEMEALILECSEIKHYKPKYNILLKDDKAYPYIKITAGDYPRIEITRKKTDDKGKYFGPYTGSVALAADTARKVFKIPSCSRRFPADFGKGRPCINYDIGNCCGLCTGSITSAEYKKRIQSAERFFKGCDREITQQLEEEMGAAAQRLEYEKAALIRDKIKMIKRLSETQTLVGGERDERDVFGIAVGAAKTAISFIAVRGGRITGKKTFDFLSEDFEDKQAGLENFLLQYYDSYRVTPPEVIIPFDCRDNAIIRDYLSQRRGKSVKLTVPQRGSLKQLIDTANKNAYDALSNIETEQERVSKALLQLKEALRLDRLPERIEIIDISHTQGSDNVGAIVTYVDGKKSKGDYKKFIIKSFDGADDCASMREVLGRRFEDYRQQKAGFDKLPDVLFVDGGEAQLHAALDAAGDLPVNVFGLVKDDKHKTHAVISKDGTAEISMTSPAFSLVAQMQEEVHRYVIGYHRQKRSKSMTRSKLDLIPGIGKAKKAELIKTFGSLANIERASAKDIAKVKGFGIKQAQELLDYLKNMS